MGPPDLDCVPDMPLSRILLVVVLAAAGGLLLYRAAMGGGPLMYFLAAVFLGMAFAAMQSGRRPPGA